MIRAIISRLNFIKLVIALIAVVSFFSAIAVTVTSQTGFCNSCHIMNDYYGAWEKSVHSETSCLSCHVRPGLTGYMKGKINGLAQAVDCIVGRVGTKAEATVLDVSCLRSACHNKQTLLDQELFYNNVKFTHQGHVDESLDGIRITCGTCHNHRQQDDHFSVDREVCYTCHFVRSDQNGPGLVQSQCLDCHDVPEDIIDLGLVTIDHQSFLTYDVNCENSCHQRQVEHVSRVSETACLHCHTFGMKNDDTSEELHAYHSEKEKVECVECHGTITHGPDKTDSLAAMMDCQNCHTNTHAVQRTIFSSDRRPHESVMNEKVLSPMFLTHVECTGCHVEKTASEGLLDSLGTVARATPEACDACHEAGTGHRYIPFWQTAIKELYLNTFEQAERLQSVINGLDGERQSIAADKLTRARLILESVRADGSWGVHNLKYTEALLRDAKHIMNEIEPGPQ